MYLIFALNCSFSLFNVLTMLANRMHSIVACRNSSSKRFHSAIDKELGLESISLLSFSSSAKRSFSRVQSFKLSFKCCTEFLVTCNLFSNALYSVCKLSYSLVWTLRAFTALSLDCRSAFTSCVRLRIRCLMLAHSLRLGVFLTTFFGCGVPCRRALVSVVTALLFSALGLTLYVSSSSIDGASSASKFTWTLVSTKRGTGSVCVPCVEETFLSDSPASLEGLDKIRLAMRLTCSS